MAEKAKKNSPKKNVAKGSEEPSQENEEPPPKPRIFKVEAYQSDPGIEGVNHLDEVRLTSDNKKVILDTWQLMSNHMDTHGPRIFKRIFEVSSKIQKVFMLEDVNPQELEQHPTLLRHSKQFMEAIEYAVFNMEQLESPGGHNEVSKVFLNLGKHHIHFTGLEEKHFNVFTGSILYVLSDALGEEFNKEVRSAWSRLLDYLIQHIQHGWKMEVKARGSKV